MKRSIAGATVSRERYTASGLCLPWGSDSRLHTVIRTTPARAPSTLSISRSPSSEEGDERGGGLRYLRVAAVDRHGLGGAHVRIQHELAAHARRQQRAQRARGGGGHPPVRAPQVVCEFPQQRAHVGVGQRQQLLLCRYQAASGLQRVHDAPAVLQRQLLQRLPHLWRPIVSSASQRVDLDAYGRRTEHELHTGRRYPLRCAPDNPFGVRVFKDSGGAVRPRAGLGCAGRNRADVGQIA
jgi:hypothetical protein